MTLARSARDNRGLAFSASLVGCAKPVPAFRPVGVAVLCRIDHEACLFFRDDVILAGREIIRRLGAAVKHHYQRKRLAPIAAEDKELVSALPA